MKKLRIKKLYDGSKTVDAMIAEMVTEMTGQGYTPAINSFNFDVIVDVDELRGDDLVVKQEPRVLVRATVLSYEED